MLKLTVSQDGSGDFASIPEAVLARGRRHGRPWEQKQRNTNMKKLPNAVKWLIIVVVLALMGWMLVKVNDRASRVKMPEPDNSLGIYRKADA